jgi:hypothetical protein
MQVLAVPVTAVLYEEEYTCVFRIHSAQPGRIAVVSGHRVGEWREDRDGLQAVNRIVVRDVAALSDAQVEGAVRTMKDG